MRQRWFALAGLLLLVLLSIYTGAVKFPAHESFSEIVELLLVSRLPRTFAILLTGSALAVSGLIMQIVLRNRFVEPSMVGSTQGAVLGLLLGMIIAPSLPVMGKMICAMLSAFLAMIGFFLLQRRLVALGKIYDPLLLALVGIIYSAVLGALTTFIAYQTDTLQLLGVWIAGDFSAVIQGRYELLWIGGGMTLILYLLADRLTIAGMGEHMAKSLGVYYRSLVLIALLALSLMSALVVVSVGSIAFLGLIVPNVVRRFYGDNLRHALPCVAYVGASFLLLCDILSRVIRYPYEVPVGNIVGVLGAVCFLYYLLKTERRRG